jgi:hypothetical protein
MQITLIIPDEVAAQAQKLGMPVEEYVQSLVEQARPKSLQPGRPRTPEQVETFFAAMAEGSEKLPLLPTESFKRESFYEDRR